MPTKTQAVREYNSESYRTRLRTAIANELTDDDNPDGWPVVNVKRRIAACASLQMFCETYHPARFSLTWAPFHLEFLDDIQQRIVSGGQQAAAKPRGSGKTSIVIAAMEWAALTGRRKFLEAIAVNDYKATDLIRAIKVDLTSNALLLEDFPEVCQPLAALGNRKTRCRLQTFKGEPTSSDYGNNRVVLPACVYPMHSAGKVVSKKRAEAAHWGQGCQSVIEAHGIESGNIRGTHYVRPDTGETVRPDFVLLDDPQDDEVAVNPASVLKRSKIIDGAIMQMAGPQTKMSAFMACTVIASDDLASQYLDRKQRPQWGGTIVKMLPDMPKNMPLWDKYAEVRQDELERDNKQVETNAFFLEHQQQLLEGASWSWPQRVKDGDVHPLQTAMHIFYDTPSAFYSEFQNEPFLDNGQDLLSIESICDKQSGLDRYVIPGDAAKLCAFIDVQGNMLFYCVMAITNDFRGFVVDYGAWPEQKQSNYTKRHVRNDLSKRYPGMSAEARWLAALTDCVHSMNNKPWQRVGGGVVAIDKIGIDAGYGESTSTVRAFCSLPDVRSQCVPTFGRYVGAVSKPICDGRAKPGEELAPREWHVRNLPPSPGEGCRHTLYDANYYKSLTHQALAAAAGTIGKHNEPGSLVLFKQPPQKHRLFAQHLHAETPYDVSDKAGRSKREWKQDKPSRPDNDFFDCLAGCYVMSILSGITPRARSEKRRKRSSGRSLADMKRQAGLRN